MKKKDEFTGYDRIAIMKLMIELDTVKYYLGKTEDKLKEFLEKKGGFIDFSNHKYKKNEVEKAFKEFDKIEEKSKRRGK